MTAKQEQRVLDWLNRYRVRYGIGPKLKKLPPPAPIDDPLEETEPVAVTCPIAQGLKASCGYFGATVFSKGGMEHHIKFPRYVQEFQVAHDEDWGKRYEQARKAAL